jgi:Lrp/AsnC family leucine-responsive transcriptional regulator
VNVRLLAELHANPRMSMSELARRVGMSAPAVTDRVQRLERAGVIAGFRMDVAPAALDMAVTELVRIRLRPLPLPAPPAGD